MPRLLRTPQAAFDLLEIWQYIAVDEVTAADRFLDKIEEKCQLVAGAPMLGRARPELGKDLRSLAIGNYVIFYRPIEDGITIIRVLNGSGDIDSLSFFG